MIITIYHVTLYNHVLCVTKYVILWMEDPHGKSLVCTSVLIDLVQE